MASKKPLKEMMSPAVLERNSLVRPCVLRFLVFGISSMDMTSLVSLSHSARHRGVGDHAASTHDLGQIASRHDRRWLIIDAALEASGAPG